MLVFKIMVICALVLCVANALFGLHVLITSNKMINSVRNWAEEIDRSNLRYIKSEFARLIQENNLKIILKENEQGNDFVLTEDDEKE